MTKTERAKAVIALADELRIATRSLEFESPVAYVYAPLDYAWRAHRSYLERYAGARGGVLLVGMNPVAAATRWLSALAAASAQRAVTFLCLLGKQSLIMTASPNMVWL